MPSYEIIRSQRRTAALQVTREGRVVVRVPLHMAERDIHQFVASHTAWLAQAQARAAAFRESHPPLSPHEVDLLRRKAAAMLPDRVAHYAAIMDVAPASVRITAARTRFGSCSWKNRLCFSLYLMQYPEEAIDYVVVHELAHIRHHDHSPAFYAEVAKVMPDYRQRAKLLKA